MLILYVKFHSPLPAHLQSSYLEQLPDEQVERIRKFRRWQDQHASLFGKLLLIKGLEHFDVDHQDISQLQYTEYGKPYLEGKVRFNIAHSNEYVLCIVAENCNVGIDVEYINRDIEINDFERIFSDREWHEIHQSDDPVDAFYFYWSLKESVIKADGRGLSAPIKETVVTAETTLLDSKLFYFEEIVLDKNYKMAIACDQLIPPYEIKSYDPLGF